LQPSKKERDFRPLWNGILVPRKVSLKKRKGSNGKAMVGKNLN